MFVKLASLLTMAGAASAVLQYAGVNESGYEWGTSFPGTYQKDYIDPATSTISYWRNNGANTFRYAFSWERAQPSLGGNLDSTYVGRISNFASQAAAAGGYTILDPHNYARYNGQLIGSGVSQSQYADLWTKLANQFKSNSNVIFGLMNEPHDIDVTTWFNAAQAAINAIRATGATNLILVPGVHWTGAHNWLDDNNAATALKITDSKNNFAFEVHQYFDSDFSGSHTTCAYSTEQLDKFTNWLKSNNRKGFLGEWAGTTDSSCSKIFSAVPQYLASHSDVYIGHTFWAAGPWWGSAATFPIEPVNGQDTALTKLIKAGGAFSNNVSGGTSSGSSGSSSSGSTSTGSCTDVAPSSDYTCAQQAGWGKLTLIVIRQLSHALLTLTHLYANMKQSALLAVLAAALAPLTVSAQGPCDLNLYQTCKDTAAQYLTTTCGPLNEGTNMGKTMQNSTVTLYAACQCYQASQVVLCYQQCASNSTLQAELQGGAIPTQTSLCNAAQLNPAKLPTPAPWQTFFASTTTSSVPATGTATASASGTATGTSTANSKSGAIAATSVDATKILGAGLVGLMGVVAMLV
ncbi:hypothetical protein HDV00_002845 [Rhizophlyctis rosea]|nr:hypothetical protein HDV00_002845 [Rhizophlyctis rosea]